MGSGGEICAVVLSARCIASIPFDRSVRSEERSSYGGGEFVSARKTTYLLLFAH